MKQIRTLQLSLVMALAAVLSVDPAHAQGKGKGHGREKHRTEAVRRSDDHRRDRDDQWDDDLRLERRNRRVPPGWCQGKGNPHNTVENCGYSAQNNRRYDSRYEQGRYSQSRSGQYGGYGSYDSSHQAYHQDHDRVCRERAAQRPYDVRWQLQVRSECRAEHDRWHGQYDQR
ncbi:MAG: hypothetical protein JO040_10760 [Gemmatimonadetes bacterium]|nr:hypothetical protein [Gemmatimonadota bacterium]